MGGPNTGPGKHRHTSVLDLGLLKELSLGEHVREGVVGILKLSKGKRVPGNSSNLFKSSGGDRSDSLGRRGRCESSSRGNEGSRKSEGKLGIVNSNQGIAVEVTVG